MLSQSNPNNEILMPWSRYGTLGRAGIYEFREQMRLLAGGAPSAAKISLARRLLSATPGSHPLARNPNGGFEGYGLRTLCHRHTQSVFVFCILYKNCTGQVR